MINEKIHSIPFESLHDYLKAVIERYAFYLTRSREDIEDTSQEIFLRLWPNWKRLGDLTKSELEDYIYAMTRNYLFNKGRTIKRERRCFKNYIEISSEYHYHDEIVVNEGFKVYQQAVEQLPEREKLVYLFHESGFDRMQIAETVQRSENTVNNQLRSASQTVKKYLNKNFDLNISEDGRRKLWRLSSLN
jgi:RNA polymerase sigma factor (sigma-70 family)